MPIPQQEERNLAEFSHLQEFLGQISDTPLGENEVEEAVEAQVTRIGAGLETPEDPRYRAYTRNRRNLPPGGRGTRAFLSLEQTALGKVNAVPAAVETGSLYRGRENSIPRGIPGTSMRWQEVCPSQRKILLHKRPPPGITGMPPLQIPSDPARTPGTTPKHSIWS